MEGRSLTPREGARGPRRGFSSFYHPFFKFCVTVPLVMIEAMELKNGDELEWFIEDKKTMILRRKKLREMGDLKCDFQ